MRRVQKSSWGRGARLRVAGGAAACPGVRTVYRTVFIELPVATSMAAPQGSGESISPTCI
jgi:hypothetical protein